MRFLVLFTLAVLCLAASSQKVKIELYSESLCPFCNQFMEGQVAKALDTPQFDQIMEFGLYPYGNAHTTKNPDGTYKFQCQHGEAECLGNLWETCGVQHITGWDAFRFAICLSKQYQQSRNFDRAGQACAPLHKADYNVLYACVHGPEGNKLEYQMALKTDALVPRHQYVPWIVVNGSYSEQTQDAAQSNLIKFVCQNYRGSIHVPACSNFLQDQEVDIQGRTFYGENVQQQSMKFLSR